MATLDKTRDEANEVKIVEQAKIKSIESLHPDAVIPVDEHADSDILGISKTALDCLQTNVFIGTTDFRLVYANKKAIETIRYLEPEIKRVFNVGLDDILGGSIHRFHRDPAAVEKILTNPAALPHQKAFAFGNVVLSTNINAIKDPKGEILGYVVNWEDVSESVRQAKETARLHSAIDGTSTAMMMIDRDFVITYVNPATTKLFQKHETTFQNSFPGFDANSLLGSCIDKFHANPERQRTLLSNPANLPYSTNITIGDLHFTLNITAMIDEKGDFIGNTMEWYDITDKFQVKDGTASSVQELAKAASNLLDISNQIASNAEETSMQSNNVSDASSQVSMNIDNVAAAIEEMNTAIKEIANRAGEASNITDNAVTIASGANETISSLGDSSKEISKVIKVITSIAQQTNLLALNATIEAARAGEAGKGFAVVANEVKELAKETASATEDITQIIEKIQKDTEGSVDSVKQIVSIIKNINDISNTIAAAVEEQSVTAADVANNVAQASTSAATIVDNIGQVTQAAAETSAGAEQMRNHSQELSELSRLLESQVSKLEL